MGKKKGPKQKKKYDSDEEENVEEETVVVEEPKQPEKAETPAPVEAPTPAKEEPKVGDKPSTAYPVKVEYCKVCSLPIEYCEFSDRWVKCQEYLAEAFPDKLKELRELRENDKNKNKVINKKVAAEAEGREPQGKKKKVEAELVVTITSRSKKKHVTTITGTDHFGIDANALAKILKKKFSSGASVVSKPELAIEIQGDFRDEIFDIVTSTEFNVPPENMVLVAEKKRVKYTDR